MPTLGKTVWDQAKGRELYDTGMSYVAIGRALGVTNTVVSSFAYRHWPKRDEQAIAERARQERSHALQARHALNRGGPVTHPARVLRPGESTLAPLASLEEPIWEPKAG